MGFLKRKKNTDENFEISFENESYDEYDDDDDDEGGSDVGCMACGNPAYPMCKDSCPLFD